MKLKKPIDHHKNKEKILALINKGMTPIAISEKLDMSYTYTWNHINLMKKQGIKIPKFNEVLKKSRKLK